MFACEIWVENVDDMRHHHHLGLEYIHVGEDRRSYSDFPFPSITDIAIADAGYHITVLRRHPYDVVWVGSKKYRLRR